MKLLKNAPETGSRNGKTKELTQVCISHSDPTDRLISFESRKEDLIAQIAETIWIVGGSRQLKYLSPFLPRAIDYSDDQSVWRAGYGYRIRSYAGEVDQLKEVLNILKTDLYSRRAFLAITDSRVDLSPGKDIACNQMINFLVRPDDQGVDRLNMTVTNRSNDCFVYDTKIPLLDGTTWEIGKLAEEKKDEEFWVYSNDGNGNFVPGLAHHPRLVREVTELIEVTLDNDCTERCTPDHLWMLRDGTYREAQHLKEGDSLMPLYRKLNKKGYEEILNLNSGEYEPTHKLVNNTNVEEKEIQLEKLVNLEKNKFLVTHHIDFNKRNNTPENLQWMGFQEHLNFHGMYAAHFNKLRWGDKDYQAKMKLILAENGRKTLTKLWLDEKFRYKLIQGQIGRVLKPESIEKGKLTRATRLKDKEYSDRVTQNRRKGQLNSDKSKKAFEINRKKLVYISEYTVRQGVSKIFKIFDYMLASNIKLTRENYNLSKKLICKNAVRYDNLEKYPISSHILYKNRGIEDTSVNINYSVVNHKVVSVLKIAVEPTPVYDLTVEKYNNFALSSGVHVHNCLWGYSGINFHEFSFLQELVANFLGVGLGYYVHQSMSFHIYEQHWERMEAIIAEGNKETLFPIEVNTKCPRVNFSSLDEFDHLFSEYKGAIESLNSGTNTFDVWNNFREILSKDYKEPYLYFEIPILYLCLRDQLFAFDEKVQGYISDKYYKEESLFFKKISKKFKKRIERHNYAKP